jgi:SnoaL-like polyketide cyclase
MKRCRFPLSAMFATVVGVAVQTPALAQAVSMEPPHEAHVYTPYEQLIHDNVVQFHANFDNREFEKNGFLVADNLHVDSNGTELHGRDEFVRRIGRFVGPFPDVKITDLDTIVDGNVAVVRFVITGTHKGDLPTPAGIVHATNRPIRIDGIEYFTFDEKGKLIDLVTVEDLAGLFRQINAKE